LYIYQLLIHLGLDTHVFLKAAVLGYWPWHRNLDGLAFLNIGPGLVPLRSSVPDDVRTLPTLDMANRFLTQAVALSVIPVKKQGQI
jgi:hypothetical protein